MKNVVLLSILTAAMAFSQGRGIGGGGGDEMGGGGGRDMGGGMGGMQPRRATKAEQFADKLKLTKEQREETQKILSAAMERTMAVRAELDTKRANLAGSIIDGKTSEEQSKLAADFAASAAQLTRIEADAFAKIWATLKPNQQGKGAEAFELMTGLFHLAPRPAGRGGMGGGMGRGRGTGR